MYRNMTVKTFDDLQESLMNAKSHPRETGWDIYRYMKENIETMNSMEARTQRNRRCCTP